MPQARAMKLLSAVLLAGCAESAPPQAAAPPATGETVTVASADLLPTRRSEVRGSVKFRAVEGGILVRGNIVSLPHGLYGFGIHEGDCSAHDAKSARAYLGPADAAGRPVGRLDDVASGDDGVAKLAFTDTRLKLSGPGSIVGKALVVHAWPYDPKVELERVPFLACGVIRAE
jgi:Cu-Zn family superoxide dismutase